MALGIQTESGGGDFTPWIKYDARAGRMFRQDRTQTATGWNTQLVDITSDAVFAADMTNIMVGWLDFPTGAAPIRALVRIGHSLPPKPTDKARQGFEIRVWGQKLGGWRILSSNARVVTQAFDALHDQYMAAPERQQDMLPVLQLVDATPVKSTGGGQVSTNYAPVFNIVSWVARPPSDQPQGGQPAAAPPPAAVAPAPAQPVTAAPPPPVQSQPAAASRFQPGQF